MEYTDDSSKISFYSQIQKSLCNLKPNSSDEEINILIQQIPKESFNNNEDLMVICQLFAYYPRNGSKRIRRNVFKLFSRILDPIKKHLQDQSSFFWNIFGGIYYFKQYMYEEGLISIEKIIHEALIDKSLTVAQYFLPEISEKSPEIFEREIKNKLKTPYSEEYINEYKELRRKHLKWLQESNDFNDPLYREIEKDPLRLSIKTDDIDTFQSILSNSNISINSKVEESVLENSYFQPAKVPLIHFAIEFNSMKIFKYLIMNDVKIENETIFYSIRNQNCEMIHIIESRSKEKFKDMALKSSISCWNYEMAVYFIENYDSIFEGEINNTDMKNKIIMTIADICYSTNFIFFESIFLPFLKKNSKFVHENINEIIFNTIYDQTSFFTKEFMKYPGSDIKYRSEGNVKTFLGKAIQLKNLNTIEYLITQPEIDLVNPCYTFLSPFMLACNCCADTKVLEIISNSPKFDINLSFTANNLSSLDICILVNNFSAIEFIFNRFPDYNHKIDLIFFTDCLRDHKFITLKLILNYVLIHNEDQILEIIKELMKHNEFTQYFDELNPIFKDLNIYIDT